MVLVLISCITASEVNLMQEKESFSGLAKFEDYQLQPNDEVYCNILTSNAEFATYFNGIISSSSSLNMVNRNIYVIYDNGYISIPYFGDIKLAGLTIPEAEQLIQQKMSTSVPDAQVTVRLRNKQFYIVSSKAQNGVFRIYKDNMTIFQALAISGQPNDIIDYKNVKIVRVDKDGRSVEKSFDLRSTSIIESEFYYIKPNDVIYYSTSQKKSFFQIRSAQQLITSLTTTITAIIVSVATVNELN